MNKKLVKTLIIVLTALLILGGTAGAVLYYMGDRIVEEAIRDDISLETSESGQAAQADENIANGSDESAGTVKGNGTENSPGTALADAQVEGSASAAAGEKASSNASGTTGKNTGTKNTTNNKDNVIVKEKITEIKNEVTAEDKISAAALILKRLSANDINELKGMLAGGLSTEEKEKAKELAYSKFTKEEIAEIKEMYAKYMN